MDCLKVKEKSREFLIDLNTMQKTEGDECNIVQEVDMGNARLVSCHLSGSRAYGWKSPTSDYDVRCIHALPADDFLKLTEPRDTIERGNASAGAADFVSFEMKKAISLMLKGNGNVTESIISTPVGIYDEDLYELVQSVAHRSVTKRIFNPYKGFAYSSYKDGQRGKLKPMLNTYRILMTGIKALNTGEIEVDINKLKVEHSYDLDELLEKRKNGVKELSEVELKRTETEIKELFEKMEVANALSPLRKEPSEGDYDYIEKELVRLRKGR
jgi:hypothetical protein